MTEWLVAGSRLATGSSASISSGRCMSARAIPTRCCCPPDSASARPNAFSMMPTRPRFSKASATSSRVGRPTIVRHVVRYPSRPASTLVKTELRFTRLNCWKIMPMRRRMRRSSGPFARVTSIPSNVTVPDVGSTRRLMHRSSVDLPEPDKPMSTMNSPLWKSSDTPSSARVPEGG